MEKNYIFIFLEQVTIQFHCLSHILYKKVKEEQT